jgi:hypothetical protein
MSEERKTSKVTLDIEYEDLLNIVAGKAGSKARTALLTPESREHSMEAEELKKAWFNHMLLTVEKLAASLEKVKDVDIVNLRTELKGEIDKLDRKLDTEITAIEARVTQDERDLDTYKQTIIKPLSDKVLHISVKLAMYGVVSGSVGAALMALAVYSIKVFIASSTGIPVSP